jgi:hypothetical protein
MSLILVSLIAFVLGWFYAGKLPNANPIVLICTAIILSVLIGNYPYYP